MKIEDNGRYRKLTEWEYYRLMGFTDDDFRAVSEGGISRTQIYKTAGNSIAVPVLEHLFGTLYLNNEVSAAKNKALAILDAL